MLHNNIKLNILNGIMFKKRPLRCDSDGVRAKTWTLGVWGWTLTECVQRPDREGARLDSDGVRAKSLFFRRL